MNDRFSTVSLDWIFTIERIEPVELSRHTQLPFQGLEKTPCCASVEMPRRRQSSTLISLPGLPAHALKPPWPFFFMISYSNLIFWSPVDNKSWVHRLGLSTRMGTAQHPHLGVWLLKESLHGQN